MSRLGSVMSANGLFAYPSFCSIADRLLGGCASPLSELEIRRAWLDSNKRLAVGYKDYFALGYNKAEAERRDLFRLGSQGFLFLKDYIDKKAIEKHFEETRDLDMYGEGAGQKLETVASSRAEALKERKCLRYFYRSNDAMRLSLVDTILNDKYINDVVSGYLRKRDFDTSISAWLSVGKPSPDRNELSNAAQLFHFDYDSFNFLKIFVFLTDVSLNDGPHQYIKASHKPFPFNSMQCVEIPEYCRIEEKSLKQTYGGENIETFIAPVGSVLIEDTSGFHRGLHLAETGWREVIVITYKDFNFRELTQQRA